MRITRNMLKILTLFYLMTCVSLRLRAQQDSITYNSTCTNYKIVFGSSIFNTIDFPDQVSWNFGDPASGIYNTAGTKFPTHAFSSPGSYIISLTVILTGDTTKIKDTIQVIDPVSYNFGPDIYLCQNADTTITGPVVPGAAYEWNDDSLTKTPSLLVSKTGVYTVKINGCAVTDSIGIFFSDKPQIDLGADHQLCAGEVLTLNASSQNGSYVWTLNGAVLPDTLGQMPVSAPGGKYVAVVTVPGCGVFSDSVNITFNSFPAPAFSLGPDTLICPGKFYLLIASIPGATAWQWNTGQRDSVLVVNNQGEYWAFVTVNGICEVVDSVNVDYMGNKNLDFRDTAMCKGNTLILDADFGTGTYNWVADPPQRNDQYQTGQSTYYVYEPGKYSVTATVGACVFKDSLQVTYNDLLQLDIGRDTSICIGERYTFHVKTNANTLYWQDGSAASSYTISKPGIYTVIGTNGCGMDTASVKVDTRHCECELILPNAFTPNGDGYNETFRPLHPCNMGNFSLQIFNRYGQLIYQTQDPSVGWNGNFGGAKAQTGTYVWAASYINTETQQREARRGFVVLIR